MRIFYLGDIHGNFNVIHQYVKMYDINDAHIIQVGDFGVGFTTFEKEKRMLEMYHTQLVKNNVHVWAIRVIMTTNPTLTMTHLVLLIFT